MLSQAEFISKGYQSLVPGFISIFWGDTGVVWVPLKLILIVDYMPVLRQPWYADQPYGDNDCVVMQQYSEGFYWKVVSCEEKHPFLCVDENKKQCK